jgi:hypothetical protein
MQPNKQPDDPQRRRELMKLEQAFWDAMKQRDGRTAEQLTDETCLVVGPQGIGELPRAAIGGMIEHAGWNLEQFELAADDHVHFRMIDDDVAIVAYTVDESVVVDGQPTTVSAFDTSVWVRRLGKWVCAMHTETLAGDPFGRDRISPSARA